jgi:hypothetical protein
VKKTLANPEPSGIHDPRSGRRLSGVLRASRLPPVEAVISSIRKRFSGRVTWRPVFEASPVAAEDRARRLN